MDRTQVWAATSFSVMSLEGSVISEDSGYRVVVRVLGAHRGNLLQEGGCSVPVAVHTAMKDGQVSRGRWVGGQGRDILSCQQEKPRFLSSSLSRYAEATVFFPSYT